MILAITLVLLAQADPAPAPKPLSHAIVEQLPAILAAVPGCAAGCVAAWAALRANRNAKKSIDVTIEGNEVTEAVKAQGDALAAKANAVIDTAQETKEAVQKAHDAVNAVGCNHADELKALRERLEELERRAPPATIPATKLPAHPRSHHARHETED